MGKPAEDPDPEDKDKKIIPLDDDDIALLKTYGLGPYSDSIKALELDLVSISKKVNDLCGIKESDTGLAQPSTWDLTQDKQAMQEEQPLQVARCTKIINPGTDDAQYVINVKQIAKFVVGLGQHGTIFDGSLFRLATTTVLPTELRLFACTTRTAVATPAQLPLVTDVFPTS